MKTINSFQITKGKVKNTDNELTKRKNREHLQTELMKLMNDMIQKDVEEWQKIDKVKSRNKEGPLMYLFR